MEDDKVTLVCENSTFVIDKKNIMLSNYLGQLSYDHSIIQIDNIKLNILNHIIEYIEYRKGQGSKKLYHPITKDDALSDLIDREDIEFTKNKSVNQLCQIITASSNEYLDIPSLCNLLCVVVAYRIKDHSIEEIQEIMTSNY